jgi:hypothetical protein
MVAKLVKSRFCIHDINQFHDLIQLNAEGNKPIKQVNRL